MIFLFVIGGSGSTADDTILNCHGAGVANTAINTVHIFIDSSNNLNCFDVINNDNTVIASGVENIQIRYVLKNGTSMIYKEPPLSVSEYESAARIEIALVMAADFDNSLSGASSYSIWGQVMQSPLMILIAYVMYILTQY